MCVCASTHTCHLTHWNHKREIPTDSAKYRKQATSDMSCCRCNRSGRCRYCSCVKSGRTCQGCLPEQLGNCKNISQSTQRLLSGSDHPPSILLSSQNVTTIPEIPTASIADQTMPLDHTLSQSLEARPSVVDVTWPSPPPPPPPPPPIYNLLTFRGVPVVVKCSARESTQPMKKWSTGDETSLKYHQNLLGKPLYRSWLFSFKLIRTAPVWNV